MCNVHLVNYFSRVCFYIYVNGLVWCSHSYTFCPSTWFK